ncbi:Biotin synthase OS=Streptomyces albaduncus OX=68172 GN=bioB PE=3 SV=1 [Streptomyces griseoloalbus]
MVRFVCPDVEVRIAGGREVHLRTMQPLALHLANSIFLGDYLTSEGQAGKADLEMIADAGFEVEGAGEVTLPEHRAGGGCGSHAGGGACGSHDGGCGSHDGADGGCGSHAGGGVCGTAPASAPAPAASADEPRPDLVAVRRRGAGTDLAPNA